MRKVDRYSLAAYEIIGGLLSGVALLDAHGTMLVSLIGYALLVLSAASVVCGVLLWQDRSVGYDWSQVLQALQIPHVVASGAAYRLVIGWDLTLGLRGGGWFGVQGSMQASLAMTLNVHERPLDVGVNLLAIWCLAHLVYLERRKRDHKRATNDVLVHESQSAA